MNNLDFVNNKFNLSIQDIDNLYHIINNYKKDRGYCVSTVVLIVMKSLEYKGKDMFEFLTNVYYNWPTYLKNMSNEK